MKFAFADPPYLGCCARYGHEHNGDGGRPFDGLCWDNQRTHDALVNYLHDEFPDGWALCLSVPSLYAMMGAAGPNSRVGVWVKPFAVFKPNVNPAYAWEPVIWRGGRKGDRDRATVRDWHSANITLRKGLVGAKPASFCRWVLDLLGYEDGDEVVDLFPGTGIMGSVVQQQTLVFGSTEGSETK